MPKGETRSSSQQRFREPHDTAVHFTAIEAEALHLFAFRNGNANHTASEGFGIHGSWARKVLNDSTAPPGNALRINVWAAVR